MNVLFLGASDRLHPWYDDVVVAVTPRHAIALYNPDRQLNEQFEGVDVVVDQGGSVGTREMVDAAAAAGVGLWQVLGTGLDHVDVAYIAGRGLRVANTPGPFSGPALAEHALFLMLLFAKRHREAEDWIRKGVFYQPMTEELAGRVLGLVGLGASGRELATRARAFGMRVHAIDAAPVDRSVLDRLGVASFGGPDTLVGLAAEADYLSVHVPLLESTRHLINRDVLAAMKPSAVLINVARGLIVDEAALIDALREGRIRGAGLDAFEEEPLPVGHALLGLENVIATPHLAGMTDGTSRRRGEAVAENVDRIAAGQPPLYVVEPEQTES